MREIKFRAWDKKNKEMLVPDGNGYFSSENHLCFVIDGNGEPIYLDDLDTPEDIVFMQYTGLKDKHNEEIYEGDIVQNCMYNSLNGNLEIINHYIVIFDFGSFSLKKIFGSFSLKKITKTKRDSVCAFGRIKEGKCAEEEIIGNKYDNPELLEENR